MKNMIPRAILVMALGASSMLMAAPPWPTNGRSFPATTGKSRASR